MVGGSESREADFREVGTNGNAQAYDFFVFFYYSFSGEIFVRVLGKVFELNLVVGKIFWIAGKNYASVYVYVKLIRFTYSFLF